MHSVEDHRLIVLSIPLLHKVIHVPLTNNCEQLVSARTLKRHMDQLPRDRNIVLYCGTGGRAGKAKEILDAKGFRVFNGAAI
jgi:rhodanese-related sulfurtransferase